MFANLATSIVRYRWLYFLASLLILGASAYGGQFLWFASDYRVFFEDDDPRLLAHEAIQAEYTKADNIFIIIAPESGKVFSKDTLKVLHELTDLSWKIPRALRVDSITNYQHTRAEADDLIVEQLFDESGSLSNDELQRRGQIIIDEPTLQNRLISKDGAVTGINVRLALPPNRTEAEKFTFEIVEHVRAIQTKFEDKYPIKMHLLGLVVVDHAFNESSLNDTQTLIPAMFLVILLLVGIFTRSLGATLVTLVIIIFSVLSAMGITGWMGIALNQVNVSVPVIILTLAVCDCVHLLISYIHRLGAGDDRLEAMRHSLTINLQPIFLTTLTTAMGFLSMTTSDSPVFADMGVMAAIGVVMAFVFSIMSLPALAVAWPIRGREEGATGKTIGRFTDLVISRHRPIFWLSIVVGVVLASFTLRNEFNDGTKWYFHEGVPIRDAVDFLEENLTGGDGLAYSLDSGEPGGVNDPEFLKKVDAFANWYAEQPGVSYVDSYTDIIKRLNRNMNGDDPAFTKIPESRELAAQYQLLYELSLPYGLDLNNQLNNDRSATRVSVNLVEMKAQQIIDIEERSREWLQANAPELVTNGASVSAMFAHIGQNNIKSSLIGAFIALILISITLTIALRSFKFGLMSLLPNAFPALIAFGLWGIFVSEVNLAVAAVFSITIGIVVDDTVHFLSKYLHARRKLKQNAEDAIRHAFSTVGSALVVTTIALASGFFLLAQSNFDVNASMGLMTAGTICIALIFDLLFLPTVLIKFDRQKEQQSVTN